MKTKSLLALGLSVLLLSGTAQAFTQNYFHFNGFYDHGYGNEVVQTTSTTTTIGVVTAGGAFTPANVPAAFISKYDNLGNAIWHRFYQVNAPTANNICEAVGVVEAPNAMVPGFGLLCYTNAAPAQTVLYKTDVNGNFLWKREIGALRGASVAYDATLQRFLCLTQVFAQGTNNIQLVVVDANTGAIVFNRYFDGCQADDSPVTVIHDVLLNEYICLGNSKTAAGDNQIMVVRVTPAGALVYIRTIGVATRAEIAVDLVRDPAAGFEIGGYIINTPNIPFFASLDVAGAVANIIVCNGLVGDNIPRRMALINNRFMMVGRQVNAGNTNGFFISITTAGVAANYRLYGQPPAAGSEELRDISPGALATPTLMCGTHQRTVAWLGSPANFSYNWLVTADNLGAGTCPQNFPMGLGSYIPPIINCTTYEASLLTAITTNVVTTEPVTPLNECVNPNRLINPNASSTSAQVYPNPANGELNIMAPLAEGETATLQLFDLTGRLVRTETISYQTDFTTINVAELPEGVYLCSIRTATSVILEQKVVITH